MQWAREIRQHNHICLNLQYGAASAAASTLKQSAPGLVSAPALHLYILRYILMKVDAMDTRNAAATFNVLNAEDRMVAAALLPLSGEMPPEGYYPSGLAERDEMVERARGRGGAASVPGGVTKQR